MSRFLMTGWPFHGHVFPQIAIAHALRADGHDVAFATGEEMRATIEGEGFELFAFEHVGRPWEATRQIERRLPSRRGMVRAESQAFRAWLLESIPAQIADLEPVLADWRPEVIVTEPAMLAPLLVLGEKHDLPVALLATFMGTLIPGPDAPPAFGMGLAPARGLRGRALAWTAEHVTDLLARSFRGRVDELRAAHGLSPLGLSVNEHTGRMPLYLVGNIPELDYDRRDLPASVHYVGRCTWQSATDPQTAAWLERVPAGRPWVHATEGTSHQGQPFLLRMAAEAIAGLDAEGILTTGQRPPESVALGAPAPNVHVTRFLRHDDLLGRCAAMVTTGGAGSILAGLAAGVPLAVVPTTWDQPDNARRVVEAGVGVRVDPHRITPAKLRSAIRELLDEPRYAANARRLAQRLAAAGGPPRAAQLLSDLADGPRPDPERVAVPQTAREKELT